MKTKVFFFIIILFNQNDLAQAAIKLSFNEALEMAIKNNLEIQASTRELEASKLNQQSSKAAFYPKLSANLGFERSKTETNSTEHNESYSSALTLSQNLFNGFQDAANLKIASSKYQTEEANLQETKSQISYDLKSAFANYFFAKNSLNLSTDILKRREDNLRMVELRFENGRENKGSVLLSKAYLEQAKLDLQKAQNALKSSLIFIKRVLNISEETSLELTEMPALAELKVSPPNFNQILEQTPTAKKFKASLASAQASLETARANYYPSWDISGSLKKNGADFFPNESQRWSIGTSLTWSLFDGGKDFYSTNSASLIVRASEKRLENQNLELRRALQESYDAYVESHSIVKVSRAFLEAAKVRADIARSKYNNGLTNFDDWDQIENDLISRQKDFTQKTKDQIIAEAAWEKAQGTGVIP